MRIILDRQEIVKCIETYAETLMPGFNAKVDESVVYLSEVPVEMVVPDVPDPDLPPPLYPPTPTSTGM